MRYPYSVRSGLYRSISGNSERTFFLVSMKYKKVNSEEIFEKSQRKLFTAFFVDGPGFGSISGSGSCNKIYGLALGHLACAHTSPVARNGYRLLKLIWHYGF